ncbi:2-oxoglutarate synthase subunit alpha [Aliarcobacter thereius]|uniref:2-oxoglutarate synthase subunit alpha n=2 Tax=Aliarcobacter thereius TaxID=544718 RepID=A0A5R9H3M2_9BACT|nr:2-oxoglutarate synthase subunit alpha [Aliarcobacter thereius]OCL95883.1 2-oxoglutarate oxidoreductase subunit KorA [Aliarcobacter thereius LMG 24486]QBF16144.1 2-oxoglutarate:acceptor oxidoreductase, alpha subunit [Aliarcobacter thereius LMG 24486]TLS71792.1 2-oxoglutarate synthase subunit alpha [Aliarcobacter thereius]TLS94518.1 2-oxoglutarate synthase subunit alpha [Aliarcobacter thereius]TLT06090.1 2-oxoglutarate synthase subunit alpha [Aliarcobacter thereius]
MSRELISTGNELAALAAIDSNCQFFGGYPITPSSEIMHVLSSKLPAIGGACMQMEDEIAGVCSALGAAMSGKRALTATSGPGISLKAENIGLGYIAEVPLVIINVMRGGPSTGLPTRVSQGDILQAKNPTHGDVKSITLMPGNLEECYTEVVRAFNLADRFMQPIFVLLDETIGHMAGKVSIPSLDEVKKIQITRKRFDGDKKDYLPYGVKDDEAAVLNPMFEGYRYHFTGLHHGPTGHPTEDAVVCDNLMKRLFKKVEAHTNELESNEEFMLDDAEIMIIAYGSVSLGAKEAIRRLRKEGVKIGMFRPKTLWPSPAKRLNELVNKFDKILVAELNMGQYLGEIERVSGKKEFTTLLKANGRPISPLEIIEKVKGM